MPNASYTSAQIAALLAHTWEAGDVVTLTTDGDYVLTDTIAVAADGCTLTRTGTAKIVYGAAVTPLAVTGDNFTLDVAIDWHNGAALGGVDAGYGVTFADCVGSLISNRDIQGFNQTGVIVTAQNVAATLTAVNSHFHHTLHDCIGMNPTTGGTAGGVLTLINCEADHSTDQSGFENDAVGTMIARGCYAHDNYAYGFGNIATQGRATLNICIACRSENNGDDQFRVSQAYGCSAYGNKGFVNGVEISTCIFDNCQAVGTGADGYYGFVSTASVGVYRRCTATGFTNSSYGYALWAIAGGMFTAECCKVANSRLGAAVDSAAAGNAMGLTNCHLDATLYGLASGNANATWTIRNTIIAGATGDVAAQGGVYGAASGYNLYLHSSPGWTKKSTDTVGSAQIDALAVPYERGNCDVGKGDPSARALGSLDLYGRPKLRQGDVIGPVYPQRRRAENLIEPNVQFATEAASLAA